MAIGPERQDEVFKTSAVGKAQYVAKKSLEAFFSDPLHYLFFASLSAVIIGLLFGAEFSWQLYAIVGGLGVAILFKLLAAKAPID